MEATGRLLLEAIQRKALTTLYENLNDKIQSLEATWQTEDESLYDILGLGNPEWNVELIDSENFYPGTIPSLIDAPINKYPNVCTICYIGNPRNSDDDTGELYTDRLAIEIMVKSGSFDSEDIESRLNHERLVNTRIQKTLDAAHLTILDNRTLDNLITYLPAPRITIGDLFVRTVERGQNTKFYWQGGALEYDVTKYVNFVD